LSPFLKKIYLLNLALLILLGYALNLSSAKLSHAAAKNDTASKKKQIELIEADLSKEKAQLLKYYIHEKELLEELTAIENQIKKKKETVEELNNLITINRKELKEQQKGLEQMKKSIAEKEKLLSARLAAFYKNAKRGYLHLLTAADGLLQLNHNIKYITIIAKEDQRVMKQMAENQRKYQEEVSRIEKQLLKITELEEKETTSLTSIRNNLEKEALLLAKIHKEKEFHETIVQELELASRRLKEVLLDLEKLDSETLSPLPADFAEHQGRLSLPVYGKIISDTGKFESLPDKNHKGLYIGSAVGTDVKAIFPGRIDFAGQLKGYSQVIVINHGNRYFTISAYLSGIEKEQGDTVVKGEVIGQTGETGLAAGPGLYFELRKGGIALDPVTWLKVN
jgi:septal ring factor EnvC (AmiA/AmiB activator)